MAYQADPGGVFASDTHRRVLGHLTDEAMDTEALARRISPDAHHGLDSVDQLAEVLADLKEDGYASESASGWKMTKKGLEALTAPVPEATPQKAGPALLSEGAYGG